MTPPFSMNLLIRLVFCTAMLAPVHGVLAQSDADFDALLDDLAPASAGPDDPNAEDGRDPPSVPDTIAVEPLRETSRPVADLAPPRSSSRLVEEIVVTAQKREENLQDVPISIAAFSGDALDARGITSAEDLKLVTPGLIYDNLVGYSLIYMRGIGTEVFVPHAEPSVATYIDGIYFPFAHGLAQEFTKLERVEVLKGPQGTLFGRNATGGAINVISKQPSDEWGVSLDAGLRNYDGRMAKAYVTGPLFGGLSFSISGLYDYDEPYYELLDSSPLQHLEPNESKGINARLRWQMTDDLSAMVSAYSARFFGTGTVVNTNTNPTPLGRLIGVVDAGDRRASVNEPSTIDIKTDVIYGNVVWETNFVDIKILLADQENSTDTRWDYDGGPWNVAAFTPVNQFMNARTAELQLISNSDTPFADFLEWTAGLYYFESEAGFDPMFVGVYRFRAPGLLGQVVGGLFDGLGQLGLPVPEPFALATLKLNGILETRALAQYLQVKWSPTDWMNVTLGGRYQQEHREVVESRTGVALDGLNEEPSIPLFDFMERGEFKARKEDFSPRIALDLTVFDDTMLYGSWSQAFKSGTFNIVAVYTAPTYVEPEKTTAYELGLKGTLFDRNMRYSFALFHNQIEELQTQVVSVVAGGLLALANAAEATIYGAEFDITWEMMPELVPGLVLTASGGYLKGKYDSFPEGTGFDEQTGIYFGPNSLLGPATPPRDLSGNRTVRTPELSGILGLSYTFDAPGGNAEIAADVYYNAGYYFDPQNVVEQPEYYTLNARASYLFDSWNLRISLIGKNLTDEFFYYNQFANDFGVAATGGPPPSYALTLSWTY